MYENFDRSIVSKYIYQDEIYKGFSVHSVKALALWEKLLNCLLDNFMEDYHDLKTIQVIPQISNIDFLEDFYGDYFYRIKNRIPSFSDDNGNRRFITTDALPYLVSSLNIGDEVFSTYTVVRPRSFAVKPFLREEFIRYFQFVIASDESDILRNIDKIKHASLRFFKQLRMPTVLVDRQSDSYYAKKSCFHSMWINGNVESVLQCGILRKRFKTISGDDRIIIDVGGAQRLLASFLYANSDSHGLFLPLGMRRFDVVLRVDECNKSIEMFRRRAEIAGCRILCIHDRLPLKKMKKIAIEEGAVAICIPRIESDKEFITAFNRDMTKTDLYNESDVVKWIMQKYNKIEMLAYEKQELYLNTKIKNENLFYKKGNNSYKIVRNGLFN